LRYRGELWGPIFKTSYEDFRKITELTEILGKGYEKFKKILRKTYDKLMKKL